MMVEVSIKKKNFEERKRLRFARTMTRERREVRLHGGGEMLLFCGVPWVCGGFQSSVTRRSSGRMGMKLSRSIPRCGRA
jgi:hypothetical protein